MPPSEKPTFARTAIVRYVSPVASAFGEPSADFESIHEGKLCLLIERAITVRVGQESFNAHQQVGLSELLTNADFSQEFVPFHRGGLLNVDRKFSVS